MKLTNEVVTLHLKDGSAVNGTVTGVDNAMNTHLKNVKVSSKEKPRSELDCLTVRGNNIRFYQLSDSVNLDALLADLSTPRVASKMPEKGKKRPGESTSSTRKKVRVQQ